MSADHESTEVLLRQIVGDIAAIKADQVGRGRELAAVAKDAREARDAARETKAVLKEQDFGAQLERIRAEIGQGEAAMRQDLVHAVTGIRTHYDPLIEDLDTRLKALEHTREQVKGIGMLLRFLKDHAGWLIAIGLAIAAGLGWRGDVQ